jgi:hypothetical protein
VGDEVSTVKWDDKTEGNVTNTNLRRIKTAASEKARKLAEKIKATAAARDAKKAGKAKAAPKPKNKPSTASAKAPKVKKPKAGAPEGKLILKVDKNPRREGTKAASRFDEMFKYVKAHKGATVQDVFDNTGYRLDDLNWDIAAKNVEVKK